MIKRVPITEEQKKLSYAKYMDKPLAQVPSEKIPFGEVPMDPEKALRIEDRNKLFAPGYFDAETGYCVLEDGTGYVANLTQMPGVTTEMFDWWFAWHGLGELRYSIWHPYAHYGAVSCNLAQGRSTRLSLKEKYWGTTHLICEDLGFGADELYACFMRPGYMGFDESLIGTKACSTIVTSNSGMRTDPMASAETMCHFVRETEDGIELRSRFWLGYCIVGGKAVRILPETEVTPVEKARLLLKHNMEEFQNLADLLPRIYPEEKDNWQ